MRRRECAPSSAAHLLRSRFDAALRASLKGVLGINLGETRRTADVFRVNPERQSLQKLATTQQVCLNATGNGEMRNRKLCAVTPDADYPPQHCRWCDWRIGGRHAIANGDQIFSFVLQAMSKETRIARIQYDVTAAQIFE